MVRTLGYGLMVMVLVVFMAGCQTTTGETAGEHLDDAAITTAVKAKLGEDRANTLTRVSVETVRSTVYLTGVVPSADQKARAEQLARQVKGVQSVVNNLQVGP
jgi:hyperosmotically inducible protein